MGAAQIRAPPSQIPTNPITFPTLYVQTVNVVHDRIFRVVAIMLLLKPFAFQSNIFESNVLTSTSSALPVNDVDTTEAVTTSQLFHGI